MPELSFGTHFFQDLVETDIFYVAIFPDKEWVSYNSSWMEGLEDSFTSILPDHSKYEGVIRVYDVRSREPRIMSDIVRQKLLFYYQN